MSIVNFIMTDDFAVSVAAATFRDCERQADYTDDQMEFVRSVYKTFPSKMEAVIMAPADEGDLDPGETREELRAAYLNDFKVWIA